jgi:hypothetical protein
MIQNSVYVYYQLCPSCKEPIGKIYETQKIELMPPVTPDDINNKVSNFEKRIIVYKNLAQGLSLSSSIQGGVISLTSISYKSKSRLFVFKIILGEPHDIIAPLSIAPHSSIFAFPELIAHFPSSNFSCTLT